MSGDRVRFGLIGAGGIAQAYAQAFEECPDARIVAVSDVRPEAAAALGERLGCPGFASHAELLEAAEVDAVVVCTPLASHPEVERDVGTDGVGNAASPRCLSQSP